MGVVDWFNDNQGFALVVLTLALVGATVWYGAGTWRALKEAHRTAEAAEAAAEAAQRSNEIAASHYDLERRRSRGANVTIRSREGTSFELFVKGPSEAVNVLAQLCVDEKAYGPEVRLAGRLAPGQRIEKHFQVFGSDIPEELDGETARLCGYCLNLDTEEEPVKSFPFVVHHPKADGLPVTYEEQF